VLEHIQSLGMSTFSFDGDNMSAKLNLDCALVIA